MLVDRLQPAAAGRAMVAVGVVGLVVAVVGTAVGWVLVGNLRDTVDESLAVTEEVVSNVEDTVVVASDVVDDLGAGLRALDEVLAQLRLGVRDLEPVVADVGALTVEVPAALGEFQATLGQVSTAAAGVEGVLQQLSRVPLGPDYDPETTLAEQLRRLSGDLDPIVATLTDARTDVAALEERSQELTRELRALGVEVQSLVRRLDRSADLVDRYREQAGRADDLVVDSRDDLGDQVALMRALVVLGGLSFAAAQLVPLW
ncbi:MAG: hypothetical protein ACLGIC_09780, partial [Acidimicrobiia bacterium]